MSREDEREDESDEWKRNSNLNSGILATEYKSLGAKGNIPSGYIVS